jgi:hypothetical protein
MSGVLGYVLGHEDGRSSAENARRNRELVDRVFYGQRSVEVDETYLAQLRQLVERFRADSDHNFDKAELFHREALEWKDDAERHKARADALQGQVIALQAQLAERDAALGQEYAAHQTTKEQKRGLNLFRLMATWIIDAHIAGRSNRPAFG